MRSYEQYCAVAKALDVVGDRWTLLIVRELLLRGPSRYTDLRNGLPGIATNLLAERLREMEEADVVRRVEAPPPVATTLFELTERGRQLRSVLEALGHWGAPLMAAAVPGDAFRAHWLAFPVEHMLVDATPDGPPVAVQVETGGEPVVIETKPEGVRARPGTEATAVATIGGPPGPILGLLTGRLSLREARRNGLTFRGDADVLKRIRPRDAASA
jgi:DNA-binding HxlR family transcriptional regulator